jgi:Ca2+/H+ antiporter
MAVRLQLASTAQLALRQDSNVVGLSIPTFATAAWFTDGAGLSAAMTVPAGVVLMAAALIVWLAKRERDKTYRGSLWSYILAIQNQFSRESLLKQMAQGTVLT